MAAHVTDYPRPQLVRKDWTDLNGEWDFAFDDRNAGEAEGWYSSFPGKTLRIQVPFTCETERSGIHDETPHEHVWYCRKFTAARHAGHRCILHFEGCDYITSVWVNGRKAGTHTGGYERFSFDITLLLKDGENILTVRADDSFSTEQPRGKQRWEPESFACWYVQSTGIWKTVWLEEVGDIHIGSLYLTPKLAEQTLAIACCIDGADLDAPCLLEADCSFAGIPVSHSVTSVQPGTTKLEISVLSPKVTPFGIKTWSPADPALYDLTLRVTRGGEVLDEAASYFGMREIRIDNGVVLLNGSPLYQRLILDQGYWKGSGLTPPDEAALITDIDRIHALGFNGLRKHQKIEDERFLYWCDVKGMLVWSEAPAAYQFSAEAVSAFTAEWLDIVKQNYSHPCIITWTPFNESWGVGQIETDAMQQHFSESIYHLTHAVDPTRPVICNDGWEHTVSDIVTLHDYTEKGEDLTKRYADNKEAIMRTELYHCDGRSAFANGFSYRGQPVILSEYGGIAFAGGKDGAWGYGNTVRNEADFLSRYDAITTAIKELPWVCGYCYTQVSDVQQEINGLLSEDRSFKVDPEKIREINERPVTGRFI